MNESLHTIEVAYDKEAPCLALANEHALLLGSDVLDQEAIDRSVGETTKLRRELAHNGDRPQVEGVLGVVLYLPYGRAVVELASSVEQSIRRAA